LPSQSEFSQQYSKKQKVIMADPDPSSSKNIIVSGGARGIGRALSRMFLEAGHKVFIFDYDEEELEYTTTVHLSQFHKDGKVERAICNLRNVKEIRSQVLVAAKFFHDRIDVLINNGSIASPYWRDDKTMEDPATFDEWQAYIETNLTAAFAMSQACIPYMKTRISDYESGAHLQGAGPCIINIGSFRAQQVRPGPKLVSSSKSFARCYSSGISKYL
jgi:NAD(P)-dependent dehydrogenase (short-subunit alcohol dehydrogenase family)